MKIGTKEAITAILKTDDTVDPRTISAVLSLLHNFDTRTAEQRREEAVSYIKWYLSKDRRSRTEITNEVNRIGRIEPAKDFDPVVLQTVDDMLDHPEQYGIICNGKKGNRKYYYMKTK